MFELDDTTTRVRQAIPPDAADLSNLYRRVWLNTYTGIIPADELNAMIRHHSTNWWSRYLIRRRRTLIIEANRKIIGYAHYGPSRTRRLSGGEIFELYVDPDHQGRGHGSDLFEAARYRLEEDGFSAIFIWSLQKNRPAISFYRALGGNPVAKSIDRFGAEQLSKIAFQFGPRL